MQQSEEERANQPQVKKRKLEESMSDPHEIDSYKRYVEHYGNKFGFQLEEHYHLGSFKPDKEWLQPDGRAKIMQFVERVSPEWYKLSLTLNPTMRTDSDIEPVIFIILKQIAELTSLHVVKSIRNVVNNTLNYVEQAAEVLSVRSSLDPDTIANEESDFISSINLENHADIVRLYFAMEREIDRQSKYSTGRGRQAKLEISIQDRHKVPYFLVRNASYPVIDATIYQLAASLTVTAQQYLHSDKILMGAITNGEKWCFLRCDCQNKRITLSNVYSLFDSLTKLMPGDDVFKIYGLLFECFGVPVNHDFNDVLNKIATDSNSFTKRVMGYLRCYSDTQDEVIEY